MTAETIHTCSYYCERPGCVRAQRDYLAARLTAAQPAEGEEIMVNTPYDVFTLPLQPSGLSSGPRFVVHVPLVEAPAVKALQAEIEGLRAEVERADTAEALLRQVLEVLGRAHHVAMEQTLKARIPECAEFGGIAQDLDFVVAALRERLGEGAEP